LNSAPTFEYCASVRFLRYAMLLCAFVTTFAQQPVTTYSRFCATCGISGADTVASQSGQFIVHGPPQPLFAPTRRENEAPLIEAEPQLLAVTGERTRQAFLGNLACVILSRTRSTLLFCPRSRPEQPIQLVSHVYDDGFQYQLGLPAFLESSRMIKGFVQVVLQEFANRGSRRNAELPTWLVEGMNRQGPFHSLCYTRPRTETSYFCRRLPRETAGDDWF
jgi:hypothetical protein